MKDTRSGLQINTIIRFSGGRKVKIRSEVGRGASCIVYDAVYTDSIGVEHSIRVKECYPNYLLITRDESGRLVVKSEETDNFQEAKNLFVSAYKKNAAVRDTVSLTNSTVNSADIIEENNTIYSLMTMDEGTDYRNYQDSSLKELLCHIKSLAILVDRYHEKGYLHLDIKPENVLILPETEQHVLLFDFDSVTTYEELEKAGRLRLSFSEGFSAPEQIKGKIKKIGTWSDVYSVGALLYYKLFGKRPEVDDCRLDSRFDFSDMIFGCETYQPRLYRVLEKFLKKALSTSIVSRWHKMSAVVDCLNELIVLADLEGRYIQNSFSYNSACFIGRREEICSISEILHHSQMVFLSGIGGIGKTEIAKKYAQLYKYDYDSVTFAVYHGNLRSMFCDEVWINHVEREDEETEESYFRRKMDIIKSVATSKDLIIVDNFDVDMDDFLEEVLACPCKFIFTTRKDFRDFNYPQINIDKIKNFEEILELFYTYNDLKYDDEKQHAIRKILKKVDCHTMTVELIAKYLRNSEEDPGDLLVRFKEQEGITNTEEINVKQRKDHRLRTESVNNHLSILFDVFGFDDLEQEVISSLALFSGIRIKRYIFVKICKLPQIEKGLEKLIKDGWIEYNDVTDKVSLHQVIQDLVYTKLKPSAETCPGVAGGMYEYISEKTQTNAEQRMRRKVFDVFMDRIHGSNIAYARLCIKCENEEYLKKAEKIASQIESADAYEVMFLMYKKRLKNACRCQGLFDDDITLEEYGNGLIKRINVLFDEALLFCRMAFEKNKDSLIKEYISLADEMDGNLEPEVTMYFNECDGLDEVYQKILGLYEISAELLETSDLSLKEKEYLYSRIQRFYSDEDMFTHMYRYDHYADVEKAYYYHEILTEIRSKDEEIDSYSVAITDENGTVRIWSNDVSAYDLAAQYRKDGKYEEAIKMYSQAYEEGVEPYETCMKAIAHTYLEMGNHELAISCLEQILDNDKKNEKDPDAFFSYTSYVCLDLIEILFHLHDYERVKKYAQELIHYKEKEISRNDGHEYAVTNVLAAYYYLYLVEEITVQKELLWKRCVELYQMLDHSEIGSDLDAFVCEYIEKENIAVEEILRIVDRFCSYGCEAIKEKIMRDTINKIETVDVSLETQILCLLKMADVLNKHPYEKIEEALACCKRAQDIYCHHNLFEDEYLQSYIYQQMASVMSHDDSIEYEQIQTIRKKCNFFLIAEKTSERCDMKGQIETWKDAAQDYEYVDDYENELKCLQRAYDCLIELLDKYDYSKFDTSLWYVMEKMVSAYVHQNDFFNAERLLIKQYDLTIDYIINHREADNRWDFVWKLKSIANNLSEIGNHRLTQIVILVALYIVSTDRIDLTVISEQDLYMINEDVLCSNCMFNLEKYEVQNIDDLIDLKDMLIKIKDVFGSLNDSGEHIIKMITDLYQDREVEFKEE